MSAFRWTMNHPLNRGSKVSSLLRWAFHNTRRRVRPNRDITLKFAKSQIDGPIDHPIMNMIFYVRGGYYDYEAMTALTFLLRAGQGSSIGANIGTYSVLAGELVGTGGRVFAVEPLASQLPYLRRNLSRMRAPSTVCTVPLADRERPMKLIGSDPTTHHLGGPSAGQHR